MDQTSSRFVPPGGPQKEHPAAAGAETVSLERNAAHPPILSGESAGAGAPEPPGRPPPSPSELFRGLLLFPSETPLKARIARTSVEPSAGVVDLEDLSWPFEAGEDVKLLVLHVLPDFSLPPEVRTPEVGGGWSYEAIGLVIFLWPAES